MGLLVVSGIVARHPREAGIAATVPSRAVPLLQEELGTLELLFAADRATPGSRAEGVRWRMQNDVDQYLAGVVTFPDGAGGDLRPAGRLTGGIAAPGVSAAVGGPAGGRLTVALLLEEAGEWWADLRLLLPDGDTATIRVLGEADRGSLQFAVVEPPTGARPLGVRFGGPHEPPFAWNVQQR